MTFCQSEAFLFTWGYKDKRGDLSSVVDQLKSGVKKIYSTISAFAALKEGGSVVIWGWS